MNRDQLFYAKFHIDGRVALRIDNRKNKNSTSEQIKYQRIAHSNRAGNYHYYCICYDYIMRFLPSFVSAGKPFCSRSHFLTSSWTIPISFFIYSGSGTDLHLAILTT